MQVKFLPLSFPFILLLIVQSRTYSLNLYSKANKLHKEPEEFSFTATYLFYDSPFDMDIADPNVTLFRTEYLGDFSIKKMVVNGVEIEKPANFYYFEKELVYYNISFVIDISRCTSLKRMFYDIDELIEIKFTDNFDTSNIEIMDEMFLLDENLLTVDFGNINTINLKSIKESLIGIIN